LLNIGISDREGELFNQLSLVQQCCFSLKEKWDFLQLV